MEAAAAVRGGRRIDHLLFEAALQLQKDSKDSAQPLSRRAAFRAVWSEGQLGSDAGAAKAERRFSKRLADYRTGRHAPPVEWRRPGSRLAEVLVEAAVSGGRAARGRGQGVEALGL